MIFRKLRSVVSGLILACTLSALAQDQGSWHPASKTASSITGDLILGRDKLTINFYPFTYVQIRALTTAEQTAVFASEGEAGGAGNLYRLNIPAAKRFLHKNTLCGSDDVQWMVTSVQNRVMHVAFFSNAAVPLFTPEALDKSTDLCGTFSYTH